MDSRAFNASLYPLRSWTSYVLVFNRGFQTIYINSVAYATQTLALTSLTTTNQYCKMGNSIAEDDPITAYIRHFYVSNTAWTAATVDSLAHHVKTPSNKDRLAYYKFSQYAMNNDLLNYDATKTYTYTNVAIKNETEGEFVCYCEGTYPNYVNVTTDFILKASNFSTWSTTTINTYGITFDFYTYFTKNINSDLE